MKKNCLPFFGTKLYRVLLCGLLLSSFAACKKDPDNSINADSPPTVFEKGAAVGAPITKSIGPAGGTLATTDNRITVTVPPGTVTAATQFSLQPVKSTLPLNGDTICYQLQPSNVKFAKPVSIQFKYSDLDVDGSHPELLVVAYQDEAGYWFGKESTVLDSIHKTLTVTTTHFSTWGVYRSFTLMADHTSLNEGEKAQVGIRKVTSAKDIPETDQASDYIMFPLIGIEDYKKTSNVSGWKLHGLGTMAANGDNVSVTLTAPNKLTRSSTSTVEVTLSNLFDKKDPTRPGKTGKMILLKDIKLIAGKFDMYVGGLKVNLKDVAISGNNQSFYIAGETEDGSFQFTMGGVGVGSYPYGDVGATGKAFGYYEYNDDDLNFLSSNNICKADGGVEKVASAGAVNITRWGNVGELVTGTLEATLMRPDRKKPIPCRVLEELKVKAEFSMKRTQ
ncbi:hypothetical protein DVR12_06885 [Chitinophaga silvatica]|uniref:ZU5 domain-containing protein n=1 Tax=Chitinophaga silvatica TaxID=2282649 RepID=A0A3E1YF23_9BACT|nr:hypothetical protein [Chitinophaga silvatica]RFS24907.1 hypothetical protein DVR12_06885 [Chitinophaga silvatica]